MFNEYDEVVSQTFKQASEQPTENPYDSIVSGVFAPNKQKFEASQMVAKKFEPNRIKKATDYSKKYNVPVDFAERNLELFEQKESPATLSYEEITERSPTLGKWMEDPFKAAMSNKDLEPLSRVERHQKRFRPYRDEPGYLSDLGAAGKTGTHQLAAATLQLAAAYGMVSIDEVAESIAAQNKKVQDAQEQLPAYAKEFNEAMAKEGGDVDKAAKVFSRSFKDFKEKRILQGLKNFTVGGLATVGETADQIGSALVRPKGALRATAESLAFSAPALATGFAGAKLGAAGGTLVAPGAGTAVGGIGGFAVGTFAGSAATETGAWINQALTERGYDVTDATDIRRAYSDKRLMAEIIGEAQRKGVTTAGVDALFAAVGGKFLAGAKAGKLAKAKAVAKDVGIQAVGEGASEYAGQVAAREGDFSKVSLGEAITEGVVSMGQSVGDVVIGSALRGEFSVKPTKAAEEIVTEVNKAQETISEVQAIAELGNLAQVSDLQTQDPEMFSEFMEQVSAGDGTQAVYFQKDQWDDFWQSKGESPVAKLEELLGDSGQYQDAQDSGSPIEIGLPKFIGQMSTQPEFQEILDIVRTKPDGLTVAESVQILREAPSVIKQVADEAVRLEEKRDKENAEIALMQQQLVSEIKETGQSNEYAQAVATLHSGVIRSLSKMTGKSPARLAEMLNLKVKSGQVQEVLNIKKGFDQIGFEEQIASDFGADYGLNLGKEYNLGDQSPTALSKQWSDSDSVGKLEIERQLILDNPELAKYQTEDGGLADYVFQGVVSGYKEQDIDFFINEWIQTPREQRAEVFADMFSAIREFGIPSGFAPSPQTISEIRSADPDVLEDMRKNAEENQMADIKREFNQETLSQPETFTIEDIKASMKLANNDYNGSLVEANTKEDDVFVQQEIPLSAIQSVRGERVETPQDQMFIEGNPEDETFAQEFSKKFTAEDAEPIIVQKVGDKFEILDGRHRSRSAFLRGEKTIRAYVKATDILKNQKKVLFQKTPRQEAGLDPDELGYYSKLKEAVKGLQFKTMPAKDLKGRIQNLPGIKPDEMEWTGLNDYLDMKDAAGEPVKKDEIVNYLADNGVTVRQIVLGSDDGGGQSGPIAWGREEPMRYSDIDPYREIAYDNAVDRTNEWYDSETGEILEDDGWQKRLVEDILKDAPDSTPQDIFDALVEREEQTLIEDIESGNSHYSKYRIEAEVSDAYGDTIDVSIEGSDEYGIWDLYIEGRNVGNFDELEEAKIQAQVYLQNEFNIEFFESEQIEDQKDTSIPEVNEPTGVATFPEWSTVGGTNYREILLQLPNHRGDTFDQSHWSYTNIIAHLRTMVRNAVDGKSIFHVDELQSDWHQKGRQYGYRQREDSERRKELAELHEAKNEERGKLLDKRRALNQSVRDRFADKIKGDGKKEYKEFYLNQLVDLEKRGRDSSTIDYRKTIKDFDGDEVTVFIEENLVDDPDNPQPKFEVKFGFDSWVKGDSLEEAVDNYVEKKGWNFSEIVNLEATDQEKDQLKNIDAQVDLIRKVMSEISSEASKIDDRVPEAPFQQSTAWASLAFKRAISMAIQEGRDAIIITPGVVHSKRYNMKHILNSLNYKKNEDGTYEVNAFNKQDSKIQLPSSTFTEKSLADTFGKDAAEKIIAGKGSPMQDVADGEATATGYTELRDDDFDTTVEIDKQGHVIFYDKILSKEISKMVKKLDKKAKLQVKKATDLFGKKLLDYKSDFYYDDVWYLEITPEMKAAVQKGLVLFQEEKGKIEFGNREALITLFKNADQSTLVHELGHYYLEMLNTLVVEDNTNVQLRKDYKTILDFLGVEDGSQIGTEQHEKWARAFEQYLREGKAPSKLLRRIFNQFKVWMSYVYKSAQELNVELNDDIRDVFDRLVASEDEINEANERTYNVPLFTNPIEAGMTKAQSERYRELQAAAEFDAKEKMMKRLMKDREKKLKIEKKEIRERVTQEVNDLRVYNTIAAIQKNERADGTPLPEGYDPIKLNKAELLERYPQFAGNTNFRGMFDSEKYASLEIAASLLGYDSVDIFVTEIANAPKKQDHINFLVNQQVELLADDLLNQDEIAEEAEKLVHNEDRAKRVRMEYEFLAENAKGMTREVTRRIARRPIPDAQVKKYAKNQVLNQSTGMIKPNTYRLAERRYAKEAGIALAKGDIEAAFDAKQKELINHELYRAAVEAKDKIKKDEKLIRKIFQNDKKLAKTRDVDLINAARSILSRYGLGRGDKEPLQYLAHMKNYDPDAYETVAGIITNAIEAPDNYKVVPYGKYLDMMDSVKALWDLSKTSKEVEVYGQKVQIADANSELIQAMQKFKKPKPKEKYARTATDRDKMKVELLTVKALVRRFESWVDVMDLGDIAGPFRKFLFQSTSEATSEFLEENKKYKEKFATLSEGVAENIDLRKEIVSDEIGFAFKHKGELLGALLHTGNESNLKKLLIGRDWGTMDEDGNLNKRNWDAFIQRMWDEGVLTKADYDYIQAVWDLMEELKPRAQRAHKKLFGFYFDEITAQEIETPFGTYRGGYAPAKVDPFAVTDIARRAELEEFTKSHSSYTYPASGGKGFTMSRVANFNKPLNIDITLVGKHIEDVLRFSIIKPAVVDAAKVVLSEDFKGAMGDIDPVVIDKMIKPALNRADKNTMQVIDPSGSALARRFGNTLRANASLQLMFANVINTAEQIAGISIAATRISPKYLSRGMYQYLMNPQKTSEAVREKSQAMRVRTDAQMFEMEKRTRNVFSEESNFQKMKEWGREHAYFMQTMFQNVVDNAVWISSYNESIANGLTDDQAVRKADADIRLTQSSRRPIDISNIETNVTLSFFQMFMNFFNMLANLNVSNFSKLYYQDMNMKQKFSKGLYLYSMGFASVAIVSAALRKAAAGGIDEDEDGEYLDDLYDVFIGSQIDLGLAMIPVAGSAVQSGVNQLNEKPYDDRVSASPAMSALGVVTGAALRTARGDIVDTKKNQKKTVKDALTALGIVTGLPTGPLGKPVGYTMDVRSGKAKPKSTVDALRGAITGRPGVR